MSYATVKEWTTAIADAIRAKEGTTAQINHADFPDRIAAISSAGAFIDLIRNNLAQGETTIDSAEVDRIGNYGFYRRDRLVSLILPNCYSIGEYGCGYCYNLATVDFPALNIINSYAFVGCAITEIDLKSPNLSSIGDNCFWSCTKLTAVIIRKTTAIARLVATNAFNNTPVAKGTGYIYVPQALLAAYQGGTNWSTYAAQIRALEAYTTDGTATGELDPEKI